MAIALAAREMAAMATVGATKKNSLGDVGVILSRVTTQITGTVGSRKTDPFSAQAPNFGN